jgi:hypothetical protein
VRRPPLLARAASAALALAALAAILALAPAAAACPVCFGEADDPVLDGARWSVIFLGGLTYTLFGGAAAAVFALRRRVRAAAYELDQEPLAEPLPFAPPAKSRDKESGTP